MSDYTPTTDEVRQQYSEGWIYLTEKFDRWLAAHDEATYHSGYLHGHAEGMAEATSAEHDAEVRADEREKAAQRVAERQQRYECIRGQVILDKTGWLIERKLAVAAARGDGAV